MKNCLVNKPFLGLFVSAIILVISFSITFYFLVFSSPSVLGEFDDALPPEIVSLTVMTSNINTQNGPATVTITAQITDDMTGITDLNDIDIRIAPLNSGSPMYYLEKDRISGSELDGTYEFTIELPKGSKKGTWMIESAIASDSIGNMIGLNQEDIARIYGTGSTRFTNLATIDDSISPVIKSLSIASEFRTINTENGDATFEATVSFEDNMSGIKEISGMLGAGSYASNDNPNQRYYLNAEEISTNGLTKTYKISAKIPRYSAKGYWFIEGLTALDNIGNQRDINFSELNSKYGLTNTRINNIATIEDRTAPTIKSLTVSPTEFNTSQGPAVINVEIVIEDDLSGIGDLNFGGLNLSYYPLISTQRSDTSFNNVEKINALESKYTGTITFPQYSKIGIWEIGVGTQDIIGNMQFQGMTGYGPDYINANVPNATGMTLINTALADEVTIEKDWTISNDSISVSFPNGTVVSKEQGGSFGFYRMVNKAYDMEEYDTFEELIAYINAQSEIEIVEEIVIEEEDTLEDLSTVCLEEEGCVPVEVTEEDILGTPVGTVRIGVPGLNIKFSKPVSVSVNVDPKYNGWFLTIQTFEEGGDAWANETTCQVTDGKCTFTTNHASFFSTNVIPDTKAPKGSITINSNASVTTSKYVTLSISGTDDSSGIKYMRLSNNGKKWTKWLPYSTKYKSWNLTSSSYGGTGTEGIRNVYIQFKDRAGKSSSVISRSIIYNPRKVTPVTIYRSRRTGKGNSEYIIIRNNLRGPISLKNWVIKNNAGSTITLPKGSQISGSRTLTLYTGKGKNTSSRIYFQKSSSTNFWRDKGDAIRLYTEKGLKILGKSF